MSKGEREVEIRTLGCSPGGCHVGCGALWEIATVTFKEGAPAVWRPGSLINLVNVSQSHWITAASICLACKSVQMKWNGWEDTGCISISRLHFLPGPSLISYENAYVFVYEDSIWDRMCGWVWASMRSCELVWDCVSYYVFVCETYRRLVMVPRLCHCCSSLSLSLSLCLCALLSTAEPWDLIIPAPGELIKQCI
jgi:hypothetical protein